MILLLHISYNLYVYSGVALLQKVVRLIKHVNHELDWNVALVVRWPGQKPDLPDRLKKVVRTCSYAYGIGTAYCESSGPQVIFIINKL